MLSRDFRNPDELPVLMKETDMTDRRRRLRLATAGPAQSLPLRAQP